MLGCAAIALCEFLSGLTENQIIAAVAGFSALLLAYLMPSLRSMFNAGSAVALAVFTGIAGAASLAAGLRTRSFVLGCLTFAALCLGLTGAVSAPQCMAYRGFQRRAECPVPVYTL